MKPSQAQMDLLGWAALVAALAVSASGEYELAHACGFGRFVAAGVPAALDVYALRAMRAGSDVFAAVLAMIAANAGAHLTAAHLLPVSWPLVVAVSAIAPLVLWRVHRLGHRPAEPEPVAAEVNTASSQENRAPVLQDTSASPQVNTPAPELAPEPEAEAAPEVDTEVDTPTGRLSTEAARAVMETCYREGVSVREAARRATRVPSRVQAVYAELAKADAAEPIPGQTEIPVYDSTPPDWTVPGDYAA